MDYVSSFKVSMPLVDSSNHLNNAKAVLPISLLLSKEEMEHIYSSNIELAIRYIKQAMVDIDVDIYMKKMLIELTFLIKTKMAFL